MLSLGLHNNWGFATGFFDVLFGKRSSEAQPSPKALERLPEVKQQVEERQTGRPISFDHELVGKLKEDHAELFVIFNKIGAAAKRDDFRLIPQLLRDFKLMLQTHLMVENERFYVYLQQNLGTDEDALSFVKDVRKEIDGIARAAVTFTNKYSTTAFAPEVKNAFSTELGAIGAVLVKRIAMEESRLYSLHQAY